MADPTKSSATFISTFLCIAALAMGGCAQLELTLPPLPGVSEEPAVRQADFPDLEPTAGRAQLGYDLRQAREIEAGLLADRANARYVGDAVRYETGAIAEPPALPPAIQARALRPLPATAGPGDLVAQNSDDVVAAETALEERLAQVEADIDTDESSLDDFLDNLGLGQAGPEPAAASVDLPIVTAEATEEAASLDGTALEPTGEELSAASPTPPEPMIVEFARGAAALPTDRLTDLADLAEWLKSTSSGVRLVSGGDDTGLAIDRARAVAVRLVSRGVAGDLIDIETGGSEDRVVLYPVANEI